MRPVLCLATAEAAGAAAEAALPAAAALELVHNFSLVHDDLPALDDDELRRGRPSTWAAYGEAVAILAGDALLAEALRLALSYPSPAVARELVQATLGMIGGQYLDITGAQTDLASLHRLKTGLPLLRLGRVRALGRGDTRARAGAVAGLRRRGRAALPDRRRHPGRGRLPARARRRRARGRSQTRRRSVRWLGSMRFRATPACSRGSSPGSRRAPRSRVKKRLDVLLVERGLAESRAQAQALVLAGQVPGYEKAGQQVDESAELEVTEPARFVSRGGEKLDHALDVVRRRPGRARRPRRRGLDRRVHRRAASARGRARDRARRGLRPAAPAHTGRSAGDRPRADERARACASCRSRRSSWSATSRSSACARRCRRRFGSPPRAGRRSCSSSRSSRQGAARRRRGVVRDREV